MAAKRSFYEEQLTLDEEEGSNSLKALGENREVKKEEEDSNGDSAYKKLRLEDVNSDKPLSTSSSGDPVSSGGADDKKIPKTEIGGDHGDGNSQQAQTSGNGNSQQSVGFKVQSVDHLGSSDDDEDGEDDEEDDGEDDPEDTESNIPEKGGGYGDRSSRQAQPSGNGNSQRVGINAQSLDHFDFSDDDEDGEDDEEDDGEDDPEDTGPNLPGTTFCVECKQTFYDKKKYRRHLKTKHNKNGKFYCSHCGKQFRLKKQFKNHLYKENRVHQTDKNIECPRCNMLFVNEPNLTLHLKQQHKYDKPYICVLCGDTYNNPGGLRSHTPKHVYASPGYKNQPRRIRKAKCAQSKHQKKKFARNYY